MKSADNIKSANVPVTEFSVEVGPLGVGEVIPPAAEEGQVEGMMDENYLADDFLSGEGRVALQIDEDEPVGEGFSFVLPLVPGGEEQAELEEPAEILVEAPEDDIVVETDPWKWSLGDFIEWLNAKMVGIPKHTGKDTTGIERAIAYLHRLDREISNAVKTDLDGVLPISDLEKARESIHDGIKRLDKRYDKLMETRYSKKKKKKKESSDEEALVKEAAKAAKFTVVVPLFIASMARTCINSMVSAGKDIEDCFQKLAKEYEFTKREEAELIQLLADMGYAMRRPRGYPLDAEIDTTSVDNLDYMANYPG